MEEGACVQLDRNRSIDLIAPVVHTIVSDAPSNRTPPFNPLQPFPTRRTGEVMEQDPIGTSTEDAAGSGSSNNAADTAAGLVAVALRLTPTVLLPGDVAEVPSNMTRVKLGACVIYGVYVYLSYDTNLGVVYVNTCRERPGERARALGALRRGGGGDQGGDPPLPGAQHLPHRQQQPAAGAYMERWVD